jgi:hypothetical protein
MKKLVIVLAVGMIASNVRGQDEKTLAAPQTPAATQNVKFAPPKIVKDGGAAPGPGKVHFKPPVIVNDKGYAIVVQPAKPEPIILLTKKGMTQKIRMSVWNAKPEYFENKYGKLPPPPPAPPVMKE